MWKFIKDGNTVSFFLTGYGSLYETYRGFQTLYMDVEVYKRRIHCFILCNWSWNIIRDVYTVSYFELDVEVYKRRIHCFILCNWSWRIIRDVYTVSYFVTGFL